MDSYISSPSCTISSSSPSNPSMVIMSTLSPVIIKLDCSNYIFWKSKILPAARAHDLEAFLLGTKLKPVETIVDSTNSITPMVNPDYVSWIRHDQFVMSWLLSSISEQMLGHVVQYRSAAEVWSVLHKLFSTKSKARALQLRLFLQTTKKGGNSIEEYVLKMKTLVNSFIAAGQEISDDDLILYILGGLGYSV